MNGSRSMIVSFEVFRDDDEVNASIVNQNVLHSQISGRFSFRELAMAIVSGNRSKSSRIRPKNLSGLIRLSSSHAEGTLLLLYTIS